MVRTTRLRQIGASVMLAIPGAMLHALGIAPEASVRLTVGKLIIDPNKRRRYSLDELLAQCKSPARQSRRDRDWVTGQSIGRELI